MVRNAGAHIGPQIHVGLFAVLVFPISAVPLNVLKTIEISPAVSPVKKQLIDVGQTGNGVKCYIHIKEKIGKWMGMAPYPFPMTLVYTEKEMLALSGLDWPVPDFSTISRRQKYLQVAIPYSGKNDALHLLVDSTGVKMLGEGEWKTKKHGADYRRQWRKVHLGIDAQTLEIRAIEVTSNSVGDAPILPELLDQISTPIATVTGDGAYDTKACHAAIAAKGATAIIPTRKNARLWKKYPPGAESRNEILRATQRLGRAIWKKWSDYHRRSLVETKMRCLKLLGERIMSRDFDRQVAELQVRAALLNRFTQLGTPDTVAMA